MAYEGDALVFPFTAAGEGSGNRRLDDTLPAGSDSSSQVAFGTSATVRYIKINPLASNSTSATPAPGQNGGWNILPADLDYQDAGPKIPQAIPVMVAPARRFIPAGDWVVQWVWSGSAIDTNASFRVRVYLHKRSVAGVLTQIGMAELAAQVAPPAVGEVDSVTIAGVAEQILYGGETIQIEYWVQGRGGGTAGLTAQTISFVLGNPALGPNQITMPGNVRFLKTLGPLEAVVAPAAVLGRAKIRTVTIAGAAGSSGVLRRLAGRGLSGSSASSGTLLKLSSQRLVGVTAPAGALLKRSFRSFAGVVASSGAMTRMPLKALTAAISSSGVVSRLTGKTLVGVTAPASVLINQLRRTFSGAIASSGALVQTSKKTLAGAVASAGALSRRLFQTRAGAVSSSGELTRGLFQVLSSSISPAGALSRLVGRRLSGTVTPGAAIVVVAINRRTFIGIVASDGSIQRRLFAVLAGQMQPQGLAAIRLFRVFGGSLAPAGIVTKGLRRAFGGILGPPTGETTTVAPDIIFVRGRPAIKVSDPDQFS